MKRNIFLLIALFVICTAFENNTGTDYREAYIGCYLCQCKFTSFNMDGPPNVSYKTDTLCISKETGDSLVKASIKGHNYQFRLKDGLLSAKATMGYQNGSFFGGDSIAITISSGRNSAIYIGKRI